MFDIISLLHLILIFLVDLIPKFSSWRKMFKSISYALSSVGKFVYKNRTLIVAGTVVASSVYLYYRYKNISQTIDDVSNEFIKDLDDHIKLNFAHFIHFLTKYTHYEYFK